MGDSVIIRCIYKSGTTFPARLLSITSHCIIVPCQICQLTLALLIKWTTQGRWTVRKQPVIFPRDHFSLWVSALGCLLSTWPAFSPAQRQAREMHLWGERGSKRGRETRQNLLKASSAAFSISSKSYYCLWREGGGNAPRERINRKNNTSLHSPPSLPLQHSPRAHSSFCLLRKLQHHQNPQAASAPSPLSWPFHSSKGYLMSLEK